MPGKNSAGRDRGTRHRQTRPDTLSPTDERVLLEYLANGENALAAWQTVHPRASTGAAGVSGCRLLKKANAQTFLAAERAARAKRLQMDGDEALVGITRHGRGDLRKLFKDGKLLPIDQWPDDIADCIKTLKRAPDGSFVLQLYDKLKARELMAIAGGKLKNQHEHKHTFDHAAYLGAEPPDGDEA